MEYFISSLLLMITIIGIPLGFTTMQCIITLWPFGSHIVDKPQDDGCLRLQARGGQILKPYKIFEY